jgi:tetratricopeptide (TPR) repeat protein
MAEATTSKLNSLFLLADQLKDEDQAEALAHLAYTLVVFRRNKDAQQVAERSLAAINEVHEFVRIYAYTRLAERFSEAQLKSITLSTVEQGLRETRTPGKASSVWFLVRALVRVSSVSKALAVVRSLKVPEERCQGLAAITGFLITQGLNNDAARVAQEGVVTALKISEPEERKYALRKRMLEFLGIGQYEESVKLAQMLRQVAQKEYPAGPFDKLATVESILGDLSLFERHPDEVIELAERQNNAWALVRLALFMPKRSEETQRVIRSALAMLKDAQVPDLLADVANLLYDTGFTEEAIEYAKKVTKIALRSNDLRIRRRTLEKTWQVFSKSGDFKSALAAAAGVGDVEYSTEAILKVLSRCYAEKGKAGVGAVELLEHAYNASESLEEKKRSPILMRLASSLALLGNYAEAYNIAKQAPFSGHRLAAYSTIVLLYEIQRTSALGAGILQGARSDALMIMLAPVLEPTSDWQLV